MSSGSSRAIAVPGGFLLLSGLAFGPSAGQFYLGSYGTGLVGSAIRVTGMFLVAKGILESLASAFCGSNAEDESHPPRCSDNNGGGGTAAIGALLYVGGTLYSLIDIPFAGKRKQARESRYGFAPVLIPGPQGGISPGLASWVRF